MISHESEVKQSLESVSLKPNGANGARISPFFLIKNKQHYTTTTTTTYSVGGGQLLLYLEVHMNRQQVLLQLLVAT